MVVHGKLCERCHDVLSSPFSDVQSYEDREAQSHHSSLFAVEQAARAGCPICLWLEWRRTHKQRHAIQGRRLTIAPAGTSLTRRWARGVYGISPPAERNKDAKEHSYEAQFEINTGDDLTTLGLRVYLEPAGQYRAASTTVMEASTGSEGALDTLKLWLRNCDTSHTTAADPIGSFRPTRLICVSVTDDGKMCARLVTTNSIDSPSAVVYTTLSHRWLNKDVEIQLRKDTLDSFHKDIPLKSLKQSLVDAMRVTLEMGIRHIWVDTLCIISDDNHDRSMEIAAMCHIYGGSYCTIAAASSTSNNEGCFVERDPLLIRQYMVDLDVSRMATSAPKKHFLRLYWGHGSSRLRDCQLTKRAWVFQERFLSPRIVFFCEDQLHWECWDFVASETYPEGRPHIHGQVDRDHKRAFRPSNRAETSDVYRILESWNKNVETYTTLKLTYDADRLRALAGVAGYCQPLLRDEYAFGHWRGTLPVSLLWTINTKYTISRTRLNEVAPSWSWASISGPIQLYNHDPLNSLRGARVLASVNADHNGRTFDEPSVKECSPSMPVPGQLYLQGRPWSAKLYGNQAPDAYTLFAIPPRKFKVDRLSLDMPPQMVPMEVTCLPILAQECGGGRQRVSGLILVPYSVGSEYPEDLKRSSSYRRIGMYILSIRESSNDPLDPLDPLENVCLC